jgi:hypothetical protein
MVYSEEVKATLPEELGTPTPSEVKEALAKVGVDLQIPEQKDEDKSASDLAAELDASVPIFFGLPEVMQQGRFKGAGKKILLSVKRWANLGFGKPNQFAEIDRPDNERLDQMDDFVEKSKALTAATRALISQRFKKKHGEDAFEKLAQVAVGNQEQLRLKKECEAYAMEVAEERWKTIHEPEQVRMFLGSSFGRAYSDPKERLDAAREHANKQKKNFIEQEIRKLTTKVKHPKYGDKQALEHYALENGNKKIAEIYDKRRALIQQNAEALELSNDLAKISGEEYQQLFEDLGIPMYEGDGSEFLEFVVSEDYTGTGAKLSVDQLKEAAKWALRRYPAALVAEIVDYVKREHGGKLKFTQDKDNRGAFDAGISTVLIDSRSRGTDEPVGSAVAGHELGHVLEQAVPELRSMQWGFLFSQGLPRNEDGSRPNEINDDMQDRNALALESIIKMENPSIRGVFLYPYLLGVLLKF